MVAETDFDWFLA